MRPRRENSGKNKGPERAGPLRFLLFVLGLQHDAAERRKRQLGRVGPPVELLRLGLDAPHVADAGAAVDLSVAVQDLAPAAAAGQPDAVAHAHDGREVRDERERAPLAVAPYERYDARIPVRAVYPFEALGRGVELPELGALAVEAAYVCEPARDSRVARVVQLVPVEALVVVPLAALPELAAHKDELLAGMAEHPAEGETQIRRLSTKFSA